MIVPKHGFIGVRVIEGMTLDRIQKPVFPHDGQASKLNGPVKIYYIEPKPKLDK